jgi:hypothetical protein
VAGRGYSFSDIYGGGERCDVGHAIFICGQLGLAFVGATSSSVIIKP